MPRGPEPRIGAADMSAQATVDVEPFPLRVCPECGDRFR